MDALAERQAGAVMAPQVEAVGLGKLQRVAVGRAEQAHHVAAGGNAPAGDLDLFAGPAADLLDRALVAQELVDGAFHERRVGSQARKLVGIADQRQHSVADQVLRGLVTGPQQEHAVGQQFLLAPRVAAAVTVCLQGGNQSSEAHTSELQSLMRISYADLFLKTKNELNT